MADYHNFPNAATIRSEINSIRIAKIKDAIAEAMIAGKNYVTIDANLFPTNSKDFVNVLRCLDYTVNVISVYEDSLSRSRKQVESYMIEWTE